MLKANGSILLSKPLQGCSTRPDAAPRAAAQHQQGRQGIPQLLGFITFNKFSFCVFIFCTYLVNISGMLFERNVG